MRCMEGSGKFADSLGAMVVEGPTSVKSEIGSFQLTNEQRQWIWDHREVLTGPTDQRSRDFGGAEAPPFRQRANRVRNHG